jgi:amino acid adenylation domain-containing protein
MTPPNIVLPAQMLSRVDELFKRTAISKGGSVAVIFNDQEYTYAELDIRSNQLAHSLIANGVKRDVIVGIHMARSFEMIVSLLAVLKAGGAYLPLDPSYPHDRLEYMVQDARVATILTTQDLEGALTIDPVHYCLVNGPQPIIIYRNDVDRADQERSITDLVYVIYTSGTAGRPKGVLTTHQDLSNFLFAMLDSPAISEKDTCLAITSISFDPHALEIFLPLIVGAKVALASEADCASPDRLAYLIEKHQVTIVQGTPATWQMMLNNKWRPPIPLKALCGGESMTPGLKDALLALPNLTLWNVYGPTEATVWCSVKEMASQAQVCIGAPIQNTRFYVLDDNLTEVSIGETGELHIAGLGLARGYVNQLQLTDEKFIPNPLSPEFSERLYRSGDIVLKMDDGCLKYLHRADHQVKIRGYRIELSEIESAIKSCPDVSETAVIADGTERLIAFVVTDQISRPPNFSERITDVIAKTLAPYMLPSIFHFVSRLPLTSNRKIDRNALVLLHRSARLAAPPTPTPSGVVGKLHEIWIDVLQQSNIFPTDRYVEVGGNSINLIRLRLKIMQAWQVDIPIEALKSNDTILSMSQLIEANSSKAKPKPSQQLRTICGLSPSQELLFLEIPPDRVARNILDFLLATNCPRDRILEAVSILSRRHDVFSIESIGLHSNNRFCQVFSESASPKVIDATSQYATAAEFIEQTTAHRDAISVADGNFYRWIIFSTPESIYVYFAAHHLIMDDISIGILKDELDILLSDGNSDLPHLIPFRSWINYYSSGFESHYENELEYWNLIANRAIAFWGTREISREGRGIRVINKQFTRHEIGYSGNRTQKAHDIFLASSMFALARMLSITSVPCRLVASGRNIFVDLDDSFTVGFLAHHYPLLVSVKTSVAETYRQLVHDLDTVPHQGAGFGWLRYVTQNGRLLAGAQLTDFPTYFNFLPRRHLSFTTFSDQTRLLPAAAESRSTMIGVGFVVEEYDDYFSVSAAYDSAIIATDTVVAGLNELSRNLKVLCMTFK